MSVRRHANNDARHVDEITRCPLCRNVYTDPRLIPCGHTYCLTCLKRQLQQQCNDKTDVDRVFTSATTSLNLQLICAVCRKHSDVVSRSSCRSVTDLIHGYVSQLPKNYSVQKLLLLTHSTLTSSSSRNYQGFCDECDVNRPSYNQNNNYDRSQQNLPVRKQSEATTVCTDCHRKLCDDCTTAHNVDRLTKSHATKPIYSLAPTKASTVAASTAAGSASANLMTSSSSSLSTMCSIHNQSDIQMFCIDCKQPLCAICYIEFGHSAHRCSPLKDIVVDMKRQLMSDVERMTAAKATIEKGLQQLTEDRKQFVDDVTQSFESIKNVASELKRTIDSVADDLMSQLQAGKQFKLDRFEETQSRIQGHLSDMTCAQSKTDDVIAQRAAGEIVKHASQLQDTINQLTNVEYIQTELRLISDTIVKFNPASTDDLTAEIRQLFGPVVVTDSTKECDSQPTLIQTTAKGNGVYALTSFDDSVYVTRHGLPYVEVYDVVNMTPRRTIPISGLGPLAYGLSVLAQHNCLFVSDYNNSKVHRVLLTLEHGPKTRTLPNTVGLTAFDVGALPAGLSMTSSDRLLVTCYKGAELQEYQIDGDSLMVRLDRVIRLQSDITYPWHAVQLPLTTFNNKQNAQQSSGPSDKFVVTISGTNHGVCIVDSNGTVLASFGNSTDAPGLQLKSPRCIAIHSASESIILTDQCNKRILAIDSSLSEPVKQLIPTTVQSSNESLQLPGGLCLDEKHDRLYVGEWIGGQILVYSNIHKALFGADLPP